VLNASISFLNSESYSLWCASHTDDLKVINSQGGLGVSRVVRVCIYAMSHLSLARDFQIHPNSPHIANCLYRCAKARPTSQERSALTDPCPNNLKSQREAFSLLIINSDQNIFCQNLSEKWYPILIILIRIGLLIL